VRELRILRSLLFVPADSEAKIAKAREIPADALIFDWEDSVLPEMKHLARKRTSEALIARQRFSQAVVIRFNAVGSEQFPTDCHALADTLPDGIMLSKCSSAGDVVELVQALTNKDPAGQCVIYPLIESPRGLFNALEIAHSSDRIAGLAFGAEDFSAAMNIQRTSDQMELLYARSVVVAAARAAGREGYDSPCVDFTDRDKLVVSAQRARNLGFTGQMAIHPSQVDLLNDVFSPTVAEIESARHLIERFSVARTGAVSIEGKMVDEAVLRRARQLLELAIIRR
jgi:citrate lyase subunit beta/citryl-CoA lyase